jgi:hypothetical protein
MLINGVSGPQGPQGPQGGGGSSNPRRSDFRLTTESGVPVSPSDRTSQSTIYLTPYKGNSIALYYSSAWNEYTSSEISLALSGLTSGKPYDVWAYYTGSAVALELLVWTNDTTRATAIAQQDGVYVKSGDATRRLVGTIYTTSTTTTEDSKTKRYVCNVDNQVNQTMWLCPGYTDDNAWTHYDTTSTTYVEHVGSGQATISWVSSMTTDMQVYANLYCASPTNVASSCGISIDGSAYPSVIALSLTEPAYQLAATLPLAYRSRMAEGRHYATLMVHTFSGTFVVYSDSGHFAGSSHDYPLTTIGGNVAG